MLDSESVQDFRNAVSGQIDILREGRPLEAFDSYFGSNATMFANDVLFASNAEEGRKKQEPYIAAAVSITGAVTDVCILDELRLCVFRNRSRFTLGDGSEHQIDGLCWQRWEGLHIVEERYYDGEKMRELIGQGLLQDPARLLAQDSPALSEKQ